MSLIKLLVRRCSWCGVLVAVWVLSGCAVQQTGSGRFKVGLDTPELFGQQVSSFKMADGSEGSLRVLGGKYSLKLSNTFKVIEVRNAKRVRVLHTEVVGDRTVITLERSTDACPHNVALYSVKGRDVASWSFGGCRYPVDVERDGDDLYFSYLSNTRQHTSVYRDDRLVRLKPVRLRDLQETTETQANTIGAAGAAGATGADVADDKSRTTRPARTRAPKTQPTSRQTQTRLGPTPIVPAEAQRYVPGLPIAVAEFKAALADEPFIPQAPVVRPATVAVSSTAAAKPPTRAAPSAAPRRPPRMSSDDIEGEEPVVRIVLQN